jgi:hypothetical protein
MFVNPGNKTKAILFQVMLGFIMIVSYLFPNSCAFGQSCNTLDISMKSEIPAACSTMALTSAHDKLNRHFLYVANKESGMTIYNINDIQSPSLVTSVPISQLGGLEVMNLEQGDRYIYLALGNHFSSSQKAGMAIVDVLDPYDPVVTDLYIHSGSESGGGIVKVEGDFAYLGAMKSGLIILDISNKNNIQFVSQYVPDINWPYNNPNPNFYNARGMAITNSIVYLCYDAGGIRVINCTNKLSPVETGRWCNPVMYSPWNLGRAYNNIVLDDNLAYIAVDYCGMEVIDISDTSNIELVGWWNPYHCPNNNWFTSPVHSNEIRLLKPCDQVYLSTGKSDMIVVDVSDPSHPDSCNYFGGVNNEIGSWGVNIYENQVYLSYICSPLAIPFASDWSGVKILTFNSCATGILESADIGIDVFPNPVSEMARVKLKSIKGKAQLKLYSSQGKLLRYSEFEGNEIMLARENLAQGIYLLNISNTGRSTNRCIILK